MWYVSHNRDLNAEDESTETEDWESWRSDNDVLLVLCDSDPVALPPVHIEIVQSYIKDVEKQLRVAHLGLGHFVMHERSEELNRLLADFFGQ